MTDRRQRPLLPITRLAGAFVGGVLLAMQAPVPETLALSQAAALQPWLGGGMLLVMALLLMLLWPGQSRRQGWLWHTFVLLGALAIGLLWCWQWGASALANILPAAAAGTDHQVQACILAPVANRGRHQRMTMQLEEQRGLPRRVLVNWYHPPADLAPGQCHGLTLRLRPPHSFVAAGVSDYEAWLLRRGIGATGYVRPGPVIQLSAATGWRPWRDRVRLAVGQRLWDLAPAHPLRPVLVRLSGGLPPDLPGSEIPAALWQVFNNTGTTHLMVISGLHVGMVATLGLLLGRLLARLLASSTGGGPGWLLVAAVPAMAAATGYALLAGFGLPAQRALVMAALALLLLAGNRRSQPWAAWLLALALVLTFDPLAATDRGFWFSFGAVATLLWALTAQRRSGAASRTWLLAQWAVFLGLLPLLLLGTGQVALAAPLANLVAIPLVSLVVVPAVLLAAVLATIAPTMAVLLLQLADIVLGTLVQLLVQVAAQPQQLLPAPALDSAAVVLAILGAGLLLLPGGTPLRPLGPVLFALVILPAPASLPAGQFRVHSLDVGQGLAVLVETRQHWLLYDTGAAWGSGRGVADLVLVPVLQRLGVHQLDALVVSHGDNDHAGGMVRIRTGFHPRQEWLGPDLAGRHQEHSRSCLAGQAWVWDGVLFRMLHPAAGNTAAGNAGSCVLLVQQLAAASPRAVLLPGDIGVAQERLLVAGLPKLDLLLAAHHGSNTSTGTALLAASRPNLVVFSAGMRNRFGHPRPEVQARVADIGAATACTGGEGSVTWDSRQPDQLLAARRGWRAWWRAPADQACGVRQPAARLPAS